MAVPRAHGSDCQCHTLSSGFALGLLLGSSLHRVAGFLLHQGRRVRNRSIPLTALSGLRLHPRASGVLLLTSTVTPTARQLGLWGEMRAEVGQEVGEQRLCSPATGCWVLPTALTLAPPAQPGMSPQGLWHCSFTGEGTEQWEGKAGEPHTPPNPFPCPTAQAEPLQHCHLFPKHHLILPAPWQGGSVLGQVGGWFNFAGN